MVTDIFSKFNGSEVKPCIGGHSTTYAGILSAASRPDQIRVVWAQGLIASK